jgi:hypothetical protein
MDIYGYETYSRAPVSADSVSVAPVIRIYHSLKKKKIGKLKK